MQTFQSAALSAVTLSVLFFAAVGDAHNITRILQKFPEFSTFNHYLTVTHLAADINSRETITVCAVDNSAMSDLLSKHHPLLALKNILSLHVLLDYFGAKKLHQITNGTVLSATMFQSTGEASGNTGFVNITDLKGGKVGFGPEDNDGNLGSVYVKSVQEIPYNISVIQISHILSSPEAEAPTPAPEEQNLTALMSTHGCKVFGDTLAAYPDAAKIYSASVEGGLTVFCPMDDAFKKFIPKFKNLTADGKVSLLLYHGMPVYDSVSMLKSGNGDMNTLATDGASKYRFEVQNDGDKVTLKTNGGMASITDTILDKQPLAMYSIDKVLLPKELFKKAASPSPSPAPSPAPEAHSPAKKPKKGTKASPPSDDSDTPAASPDGDPADQSADSSVAVRFDGGWGFVAAAVVSLCLGLLSVL